MAHVRLTAATLLLLACTATTESVSIGQSAREALPAYTTDGRVTAVERGGPDQPATYVRIVIVPDGKAPVRVELAPGWYLDQKGLRFSEQDRVGVVGTREPRSGGSVLVARRIRKGDQLIELRDDAGRPRWEQ